MTSSLFTLIRDFPFPVNVPVQPFVLNLNESQEVSCSLSPVGP